MRISGTLTCSSIALGQSTIDLYEGTGPNDAAWIDSATSDDQGAFSFDVMPKRTLYYSASYTPPISPSGTAQSSVCPGASSPWVLAGVESGLSFKVKRTSVAVRRPALFSGFVWPPQPRSWVHLEMYTRNGWKTISAQKLDKWSGYHFTYAKQGKGWLLFHVAWPRQGSSYLANQSGPVSVTWK